MIRWHWKRNSLENTQHIRMSTNYKNNIYQIILPLWVWIYLLNIILNVAFVLAFFIIIFSSTIPFFFIILMHWSILVVIITILMLYYQKCARISLLPLVTYFIKIISASHTNNLHKHVIHQLIEIHVYFPNKYNHF